MLSRIHGDLSHTIGHDLDHLHHLATGTALAAVPLSMDPES